MMPSEQKQIHVLIITTFLMLPAEDKEEFTEAKFAKNALVLETFKHTGTVKVPAIADYVKVIRLPQNPLNNSRI